MSTHPRSRHLHPPAHPPFLFEWVLDLLFLVLASHPPDRPAIVSAPVSRCRCVLGLVFRCLVVLSLAALVAEAEDPAIHGPAILLEFLALPLVALGLACGRPGGRRFLGPAIVSAPVGRCRCVLGLVFRCLAALVAEAEDRAILGLLILLEWAGLR